MLYKSPGMMKWSNGFFFISSDANQNQYANQNNSVEC